MLGKKVKSNMPLWWNWQTESAQTRLPEIWRASSNLARGTILMLMFSCAAGTTSSTRTETSFITTGCESINLYPTNDEEWSALCYCSETEELFTKCIDNWARSR